MNRRSSIRLGFVAFAKRRGKHSEAYCFDWILQLLAEKLGYQSQERERRRHKK